VIVSPLEHRVIDITNQVLEETSDHNVDNLTNLNVDVLSQGGSGVVLLELHTACNVLLSCGQVEFIKGLVSILKSINRCSEVEADIVHQKPIE
jgi:hypothetical protein